MWYDRLRAERERRGETQAKVAAAIGVSANTYSNYERGKRRMDIEILRRICDHFDVTADFFLGFENVPFSLGKGGRNYPSWIPQYYQLEEEDRIRVEERVLTLYEIEMSRR